MEEQHQNIDDIFRQSLDDYREVPPATAWTKVAARLDHDERSRRAGYFQRWPWIMMALLLLIGGAWFVRSMYGRGAGADNKQEAATEYTSTPTGFHEASPVSSLPPAADPGPQTTVTDPLSDKIEQEPIKEEIPVAAPDVPEQSDASAAIDNYVDQPDIASAATSEHAAATQLPVAEPAKTPATVATLPQPAPKTTGTRGKMRVTTTAADSTLPIAHAGASSSITPAAPVAVAKKNASSNTPQAPVTAAGKATADSAPIAAVPQNANQPGTKKTTPTGKTNTGKRVSSTDTGINQTAVAKNAPVTPIVVAKKKAPGNTPQAPVTSAGKATAAPTAVAAAPQNASQPGTKKTTPSGKTNTAKTVSSTDTGANQPVVAKKPVVASVAATKAVQKKTGPAAPTQPQKEATASATPKTKQPAPTQNKQSIAQKDPSLKQTTPVVAATAAPVNKQTPAAKKKPVADSVKSKQAKDGSKALPVAVVTPNPVTPSAGNTKKQTKAVKPETAPGTTTTAKKTAPVPPATTTTNTPVRNEPAPPILATTSAMAPAMASAKPQPKAHTIAPVTTPKAQPPVQATADTAAGTKPADTDTAAKPKYHISPSLAVLGGYEFGLQSPAPGRVTTVARLLFHVSPRASIGLQPTIRYGSVASQKLSDEKTYQQSVIDVNSFNSLAVSPSIRNGVDTLYHYVIRETFDSIVVGSGSVGGKSLEFELPLIFSYKLSNAWHVYGGPSVNFGGRLTTTAPSMQTYTVTRKDSLVQSVPIPSSEFVNYFGKSSLEPYSNYQPSAAVGQDPASVRFGYIFGVGYDWKRFFFDASMHQQLSGYEDVAQPIQKVYSSPYLRMSFGYILFPEKKKQKNDMEP